MDEKAAGKKAEAPLVSATDIYLRARKISSRKRTTPQPDEFGSFESARLARHGRI